MIHDQCPYGYGDPQKWCDWRNGELAGTGKRWIVGTNGTPTIILDPEWSERQRQRAASRAEAERRKFAHRQGYPINAEAAE